MLVTVDELFPPVGRTVQARWVVQFLLLKKTEGVLAETIRRYIFVWNRFNMERGGEDLD